MPVAVRPGMSRNTRLRALLLTAPLLACGAVSAETPTGAGNEVHSAAAGKVPVAAEPSAEAPAGTAYAAAAIEPPDPAMPEDCDRIEDVEPQTVPLRPLDLAPTVPFALQFADEVSPYRLISTTLLPGESLEIEAVLTGRAARFEASAEAGELETLGPESWRWTAPDAPGTYHCVEVREIVADERACLQVFVLVPYAGEDRLNGYRIGRYQPKPLRGNPVYARPRGFIEVTDETRELPVSPHFRLGQFLAKQPADWPRYVALETRLLLKLELLLEEVREAGIDAPTFHVMSGYRTPHYNAAIGNRTSYSRHTYGDAADIFVDADGNGRMDDLNGDGRIDAADARFLYDLVERMGREAWYAPLIGGLGLYPPKPHRGPFVHVDTRGTRARW